MRPLRRSLPGGLYEITTRVANGQLLATPTREIHDLILGVVGHAMRAHEVKLHAFVFMSNHYHLLISVPDSPTLSKFMCLLNTNVSRELNIVNDRDGAMWSRRFRSIPITADRASQLFRLRYIIAHGVKENLVAKVADWPGASSLRWLRDGEQIFGKWIRRTELYYARRRKNFVEDLAAFTTTYLIEMTVLPCWQDDPEHEWRQQVREMIAEIEAEADVERRQHGRRPLGVAAVLAQDPFARVKGKRSRAPSVHSVDKPARQELRAKLRALEIAWRDAAAEAMELLAGEAGEGHRRLPAMFWQALAL
ncbi:MAG: transposase [Deltaproteobacteria bacterium]|nr:transposase [Deltaproteobacteria bacterium]